MKIRGNGLKANTARPAAIKADHQKVEKDSPEQNCKHGVYIFNCDGCYDEMKNGTVS